MWVSRYLFGMIVADNKTLQEAVAFERIGASRMSALTNTLREQKAKDDVTIDWMRHRINALEKERTILLQTVAGITLPTPEIAKSEPRTVEAPQFGMAFEDMGDAEAVKLRITHDEGGNIVYDQEKA
jgi:hypothetical protein